MRDTEGAIYDRTAGPILYHGQLIYFHIFALKATRASFYIKIKVILGILRAWPVSWNHKIVWPVKFLKLLYFINGA